MWKKADAADAKVKLNALHDLLNTVDDFSKEGLETRIKSFIAENNFDTGSVLWPMRTALTGLAASPGPFEVASTLALGLGKDEVLSRLQVAVNK